MKNCNFVFFIGIVSCFTLGSCLKEKDVESSYATKNQVVEARTVVNINAADYFLDGVAVSSSTYELGNTSYYIDISLQAWPDSNNLKATIRAFSTKNGYIAYGNQIGSPVAQQFYFTERMKIVADSAGFPENPSDEFIVPTWYTQYGQQLYGSLFSPPLLLGCNLHINSTTWNPNWYFPSGSYPFMPPGWNNKVSAWTPLCVGCTFATSVTVFNSAFFFKPLGTIRYPFTVGNITIPFVGVLSGFNDRMTSFMCYSI